VYLSLLSQTKNNINVEIIRDDGHDIFEVNELMNEQKSGMYLINLYKQERDK